MRLVVVLMLALAILACRATQVPKSTTGEYLVGVIVEGNNSIESDEIREGLGTARAEAQGEPLDPYQLTVDVERVKTLYQKRGFFAVEVTWRVDTKGREQRAYITVAEGKRATTTVVFLGVPDDVERAGMRALVDLEEGAPFDYDKFDEAKQPLLTWVENAGYAHVVMDAEVIADRANAKATIRFQFYPGPLCTFGEIFIAGVQGDLADAIRARLWFSPGERYSAAALAETQRMIYELGRFSSARVEPDRSTAGTNVIAVKIALVEANRYEIKLGGGLGYEPATYEARARASISAAKVPDDLSTATLDFRPAYTIQHDFENPQPKIRLLGTLTRLDLFRPLIKGELEAGLDFVTIEAYTYAGPLGRAGISFPLGFRWLQLRVGYLIRYVTFSQLNENIDPTTANQIGLDRVERLGEFQQAITVDLRDEPLNPRKGAYFALSVNEAASFFGSAYDLIQVTPEARGYIPVGRSVLALRARVGMIFGDVPPTERYYTGGASSQRGFSERRLSPSIAGVPYGGSGAIEASIELRSPNTEIFDLDMGGVVFLDAGDVVEDIGTLSAKNLHYATGLGLRVGVIKSLVARLDLGYRLNRVDEPVPAPDWYDRLAIHLSVGQAF